MRAAVIPTQNRPDLKDCLTAILPQVDHVVIIAHNVELSDPPITPKRIHVIGYEENPPNISKMWNIGLDKAESFGCHRTAVLNDDAIVYPGWFNKIELAMNKAKAVAGWSQGRHDGHLTYRRPEPTLYRMNGFAFVVNSDLRADEQFQWWYGDNDLEWRARQSGGVVQVGGDIEHRHPNESTVGVLRRIADMDRQRFEAKWGRLP